MPKSVLMDELFVSLRIPEGMANTEYHAIRRVLFDRRFLPAVRQAVRNVIRAYPALGRVRLTVTR